MYLTENELLSIMAALIFAGRCADPDSECVSPSHKGCVEDAVKIQKVVWAVIAEVVTDHA